MAKHVVNSFVSHGFQSSRLRNSALTLISLHLPKTAGTSFCASLAEHFGDRFRRDYADAAISKCAHERGEQAMRAGLALAEGGLEQVDCVHGHFLPLKYLLLSTCHEVAFITWMRDPVARLISHFHYWKESYDEATAAPHHRQFMEEAWTLEQFCLSEKFRNIYTQYLWGFPLENFSFIGITEHYAEDLGEFSRRHLSVALEPQRRNVNANAVQRTMPDAAFLERVRDFHAADMALYGRALQLRKHRVAAVSGIDRSAVAQ